MGVVEARTSDDNKLAVKFMLLSCRRNIHVAPVLDLAGFTLFCFNAPCRLTPLTLSYFPFNALQLAALCYANRYFIIFYGHVIFYIHPLFKKHSRGVRQGFGVLPEFSR